MQRAALRDENMAVEGQEPVADTTGASGSVAMDVDTGSKSKYALLMLLTVVHILLECWSISSQLQVSACCMHPASSPWLYMFFSCWCNL